jgi:spermidine synthase
MFAKYLSYLIPVTIHKSNSKLSKTLEVTYNNGNLVLDSQNANYSFGSLQRILKKGLRFIGFDRIRNFNSVLVLGVAGGSVIHTLVNDIKFKGKITGVELDSDVIVLAKKYFDLDKFQNLELIIGDAFEFVLKTKDKYDLIIIDIFLDTTMPNFLFEDYFIQRVQYLMHLDGFILFNTMVLTENDKLRNSVYKEKFIDDYSIRMYPKVEEHNELFTIKKLK